jgi:hypothetical protein
MKRVLLLVGAVLASLLVWPGIAAADRTTCEGVEASLRSVAEDSDWTAEEKEAYIRDGAASCWEEVQAEEVAAAEQDAEVRQTQEEEAAKEAARKAEKERVVREHRPGLKRAPTVRKGLAIALVRRTLSKQQPGWRHRDYGYVDCDHGRVNRTHWRCRIGWGSDGGSQKCGRALVEGEAFENHRPYFAIHWRVSPDWCWAPD